jgi:two-component system, CAI-1 autoinducer sensor kinase/phosphatase CqsS
MKKILPFFIFSVRHWLSSSIDLLKEPLIPVLHHSVWRLRWQGTFMCLGNLLFYYIWSTYLPQPYEDFLIRTTLALLGLISILYADAIFNQSKNWAIAYSFILFIQLPLFFIYMVFQNNFNNVWLTSCVAMFFIYYQATDWRIASVGVFLGFAINYFYSLCNQGLNLDEFNLLVDIFLFMFAWSSAMLLGATTANKMKQSVANTAFSFGVMAHELRTPLAGMHLISTMLRDNAMKAQDEKTLHISQKLDVMIKTVHTHLNNQVANSRLLNIPTPDTLISAHDCVACAVRDYPYKTSREAAAVQIQTKQDFIFLGSDVFFKQVFNNLISNAFKAIAVKELSMDMARIQFIISVETSNRNQSIGIIEVIDNGIGVQAKQAAQLLEPFFSTDKAVGHGLGLAFCKQVVDKSKGELKFSHDCADGAHILISLPANRHTQPLLT